MDSSDAQALSATLAQPRPGEELHRRPTGLTLEVLSGPTEGTRVEFPRRGLVTGGRASAHDVVLDDPSVSTNHFEIALRPHGVLLRDLGSTNGTWLGRGRLEGGSASLFDGAVFYAGNVKLRVVQIDVGSQARSTKTTLGTMTGGSSAMTELFALLVRLGPTPITTLVTGETGTGKEEVARTLHELSGRKGAFAVLDCGALPQGLAESSILGHVKGAFTGAVGHRLGAFEQADGGTLFLDEIGELPLELQPKLLRVLDRREVQRIGDAETRKVDVRVVAATHRNLTELVAEGRFRLDLYHRLRQIEVTIPPLRERPDDVPLLAERFLAEFEMMHGRAVNLGEGVVESLRKLHWDGNVRQLRQMIERLAFLANGDVIMIDDLRRFGDDQGIARIDVGADRVSKWMTLPYKEASDEFQRHYFTALWELTGGDIDEICRRSGYSRKGLLGLARRFGLPWGGPAAGA